MGLFDIFSGDSGRRTAMQNARMLQDSQRQIDQRLNLGQNNAIQTLQAYEPRSLAALGEGYDAARGEYGQMGASADLFRPYAETGGRAFDLLAGSYGVNGAGGNQAAVGAFQSSPGYQWGVDQATDAVARKAAAAGVAGSGNTLAAISDRAGQMANQEYGNWRAGLRDIGQTGFNATGSIAQLQSGMHKGLGDLFAAEGTGLGNILQQNAGRIAGTYSDTANTGVNALARTTEGLVNQNTLGHQAGQTASANQWGAGMGLLSLLGGLGGRYLGGRAA